MILVACMLRSESCRVSALLERQRKGYREKVRIFIVEEVEELDHPQFPISSEILLLSTDVSCD